MWRRPLLPLAAITALALSAAAQAQDAPVSPPAAAPSHRAYSPDQMNSFARATVELQNLASQDPEAMSRTIQSSGMNVEDYNQMGDAMRADPALATSLNPYLDSASSARTARIYAQRSHTPSFSEPPRRAASHHAVAGHKASSHKVANHKTSSRHSRSSSTHKASHTSSTRHASKTSHKATTARHATRKTTPHASSVAAHKSKRHKHS
jgi:hypothetical protein